MLAASPLGAYSLDLSQHVGLGLGESTTNVADSPAQLALGRRNGLPKAFGVRGKCVVQRAIGIDK